MKEVMVAVYEANSKYNGHSRINRYHYEVGFECYKVSRQEERNMGILVNGKAPEDTFEIVFVNFKNEGIRRSSFTSAKEANEVVKNYMQHGFRRVK